MKKIKLTETQLKKLMMNEQLLKNLGDKIKSGVQKIANKVAPNKEITIPGNPPTKGRDLEQLRAEWSKINLDKGNMKGYGEAVSPNENAAHTSAMMNARAVILKKLGKQQAKFGSNIVDQALFQLENGNYIKLVVIELTKVWEDEGNLQINEEVSRIKSIMGIHENEETPIPPDVMQSIEKEADEITAHWNNKREEGLKMIQKLEVAINDPKNKEHIDIFKTYIDQTKQSLPSERTPEDRVKLIEYLKNQYRIGEAFKEASKEREEGVKTAKITKEQIIDVFVTAIEGGSNYWYYILDVPKEITYMVKQEDTPFSEACGKHVLNGGELTIYDVEEVGDMEDVDNDYAQDKPEPLGTITMDSLLDAINIMKRDYPDRYESIVMDEYDAEDADVFFQIATMGEIVYG
jgi:hypothetical protein